jgi:hypothetical protein
MKPSQRLRYVQWIARVVRYLKAQAREPSYCLVMTFQSSCALVAVLRLERSASIASNVARPTHRPPKKMPDILRVFATFEKELASSKTTSTRFPTSTVPRSTSTPNQLMARVSPMPAPLQALGQRLPRIAEALEESREYDTRRSAMWRGSKFLVGQPRPIRDSHATQKLTFEATITQLG